MRLISLVSLAVAVSRAGGFGFLAAGNKLNGLDNNLEHGLLEESPVPAAASDTLPIGVGFINWGADLSLALPMIYNTCQQRYGYSRRRDWKIQCYGPRK